MRRKQQTPQQRFHPNTWKTSPRSVTLRALIEDVQRGARFRELREARGLSLEDAAHEIGVSTKTLWNWETGHGIKGPNLKRAAIFYEVDPDFIRRGPTPDVLATLNGDAGQLDRIELLLRRLARAQGVDPDESLEDEASRIEAPAAPTRRARSTGSGRKAATN